METTFKFHSRRKYLSIVFPSLANLSLTSTVVSYLYSYKQVRHQYDINILETSGDMYVGLMH